MARGRSNLSQDMVCDQGSLLPDEPVEPVRNRAGQNQSQISAIWHRIVGLMEPGVKTPDMYKVLGRWRQLRGTDRVEEALLAVELRARQGQYENLDHAKRSLMLYMKKPRSKDCTLSRTSGTKEAQTWDKRCDKIQTTSQSQETDWDKIKAEWEASKLGLSQ